jgi:hypothetical protein
VVVDEGVLSLLLVFDDAAGLLSEVSGVAAGALTGTELTGGV